MDSTDWVALWKIRVDEDTNSSLTCNGCKCKKVGILYIIYPNYAYTIEESKRLHVMVKGVCMACIKLYKPYIDRTYVWTYNYTNPDHIIKFYGETAIRNYLADSCGLRWQTCMQNQLPNRKL